MYKMYVCMYVPKTVATLEFFIGGKENISFPENAYNFPQLGFSHIFSIQLGLVLNLSCLVSMNSPFALHKFIY